jgi:putative nucleotidyltransferase with HDIG domain
MSRLTLLAKFSITSFVLLAVLGASLGWSLTRYLEEQAIERQKTSLSALVPPVIGPYITPELMSKGATDDKSYKAIEGELSRLGGAGLVRVKIWSEQGMIVYSDDRALVGRTFEVEDDLVEAFDGETVASISPLTADENVEERGFGELLEVYTPLAGSDNGPILGVFEGYYEVDDIRASERATQGYLWSSIGLGFLLLYISLFTIVRNASRRLTRHSEENAELYREAQGQLAERVKAEQNIQRQIDRLGALRSIDLSITSSLDLRLTLKVILEHVCAQLHVDAADVLLLSKHTSMLEYAEGQGFRSRNISRSRVPLGEGYAGRAALERRTLTIRNISDTGNLTRAPLLAGEDFVSYFAVPLIAKGQVEGVLEIFQRTLLEPDEEWLGFLEALAGQAAIAVDNATLFDDLQHTNLELAHAYDNTLEGWSRALDLRDKETEGHTQRVTEMTIKLARYMGMSDADLVHVRRGALLHDIGKMGIPDSILLKPGPLTDEEWEIMRLHPVYAFELLSPISFLKPSLDIPYCHHEKWDGTGYPRKLKGEQIPLSARIFAIVDVWDALRSDRPYRKARPKEMVYAYVREQSGKHFDPQVVEAFLAHEMQPMLSTSYLNGNGLYGLSINLIPANPNGNGNGNGNGVHAHNGNGAYKESGIRSQESVPAKS